jgi:hypothetical protein
MSSSSAEWKAIALEILQKTDIQTSYLSWGIRLAGSPANPGGWIACHAYDRADTHPSACFNVGVGEHRGRYKDSGGAGKSLSFWEAACEIGHVGADWKEARKKLAEAASVALPTSKEEHLPADKFAFKTTVHDGLLLEEWGHTKGGITRQACQEVGCLLAEYPKGVATTNTQEVVVIPFYGPDLLDADPVGYGFYNLNGGDIFKYNGKTKAGEYKKYLNSIGSKPGLMNRHALQRLATAKRIFKVEGPSDALALQSVIPPELKDEHIVLAHANGALESVQGWWLDLMNNKEVIVIGDRDDSGVAGVNKWLDYLVSRPLKGLGKVVLECFPHVPDHGQDLRDYLMLGHTYADLEKLIQPVPLGVPAAPPGVPFTGSIGELREECSNLERLKLHVLGQWPDHSIDIYSHETQQTSRITSMNHFSYGNLLQIGSLPIRNCVVPGRDPAPGMLTFDQVSRAIALVASRTHLADTNILGQGVWMEEDKMVVVSGHKAAVLSDDLKLQPLDVPQVGKSIIDFSSGHDWAPFEQLQEYLDQATGPGWCKEQFGRLEDLVGQWPWRCELDPPLCASLILCSWVQALWQWRPSVAISGATASGKSSLMDRLLLPLFGKLAFVFNKPTEASIRQTVRCNSTVMLFDEFENDNNRNKILEMFRVSGRGGEVVRGTADQRGRKYRIQHIPWTCAIENGLRDEADRNRFVVLELERIKEERFGQYKLPEPEALKDLGLRLLAVALRHAQMALAFYPILTKVRVAGVAGRVCESYAMIVAMLAQLRNWEPEEAEGYLKRILRMQDSDRPIVRDELQLVNDILESPVQCQGGITYSVLQLLSRPGLYARYYEALDRVGVSLLSEKHGPRPFVSEMEPELRLFLNPGPIHRFLLRGTRWEKLETANYLLRISGCQRTRRRVGGARINGFLLMAQDFFAFTDEQGWEERISNVENPPFGS